MIKLTYLPLLIYVCLISLNSCDKGSAQSEDQKKLENLFTQIKTLAETSTCTNTSEIKVSPLGAKACGGPTHYVAYTSTIDVKHIETMIAEYTAMERDYNRQWEIISDCIFVTPPKVICENGKLKITQ